MLHTLKTLYQTTNKFNPGLFDKFERLIDYCKDEDVSINKSSNSLKWFIYVLRDKLSVRELQEIFFFTICESFYRGEGALYDNIKSFNIYHKMKHHFKKE